MYKCIYAYMYIYIYMYLQYIHNEAANSTHCYHFTVHCTQVAGSISGPLSWRFLHHRVCTNEISSSALLDIDNSRYITLCLWSRIVSRPPSGIRTFDRYSFSRSLFRKRTLPGALNYEFYLRSTSSARQNFPDEITRIT